MNGDLLVVPNFGDSYSSVVSLSSADGIQLRRFPTYRDISIRTLFVEVTTAVTNSLFAVGLYDFVSLSALLLFNSISGASPTGLRSVQLDSQFLLRANVYLLAWAQNQGSSLSIRGTANDPIVSPVRYKALNALGSGGVLPDNLGGIRQSNIQSTPIVIFQ